MHSIWSVPQAQGKKVSSNTKKAAFTTYLKEMFYTKPVASKQPKAPRNVAPSGVPQNNAYRPQAQMPSFQQMMMPAQQQFAMPHYAAPQYVAPKTMSQEKNWGSIMSMVFPILLAVLGIPFYIMVILKLINFLH